MASVSNGDQVLLLAPSGGLGGGIERYVRAVEAALEYDKRTSRRLNLCQPDRPLTLGERIRFVRDVRRAVRASDTPMRLVIAHANLLPVLTFVSRLPAFRGATVIMHGDEIWSGRRGRGRRWLRRADVRVVAASNFSAGALVGTCQANVLAPAIAPDWYETLVRAGAIAPPAGEHLRLVTAFRLSSWRAKGLATILDAISLVGPERIRLTVCGSGPVPHDLRATIAGHPGCRILPDLTDTELADEFADADAFVLATRTRDGSGEGFGLVLLEAQLAGTPVIAPAYGGSGDAFQPGLTGVAPLDESARALAVEIAALLDNPSRLRQLSQAAAAWARARFEPVAYRGQLLRALLGSNPANDNTANDNTANDNTAAASPASGGPAGTDRVEPPPRATATVVGHGGG